MSLLAELFEGGGESTRDRLERAQERADDRLGERLDQSAPIAVEAVGVPSAAVVNEGPDGQPVVVPIARTSLPESRQTLDTETAWRLVPDAVRVLHEAFTDEFVRHYDVQFAYDGDGLFEAREVDRVAVTPATVERLVSDPEFDRAALREHVEREDDIDDEIAPVAWRDAKDYSRSSDAVVVTGAAVGASAAACGGAVAGAGACGAAGST